MKREYIEPKITVEKFSVENIVTASTPARNKAAQSIREALPQGTQLNADIFHFNW